MHSPSASSPSPKLSLNKPLNCTSSSHSLVTGSLINGMASPQQLINATGAIAFPSNAHQQQPSQSPQHQHPSQHSPQQQSPLGSQALSLQNNSIVNSGVHHLLSQNLLNSNSRPKAKQRTSNGGGQSNGGLSVHSPLFGASVAFPGNPLQPQQLSQHQQNQSFQQQLQNSSSRQMQQQQHSPQQGVLLSTLSNPNGSPVRSLANQANTLSSSNAAQLVAAVAAANANNPAYVSSWPCPACKIGFRSANELQAHLRYVSTWQSQGQSTPFSFWNDHLPTDAFSLQCSLCAISECQPQGAAFGAEQLQQQWPSECAESAAAASITAAPCVQSQSQCCC